MSLRRKLLLFFLVQHALFFLIALVLSEFFIRPHNLNLEQKYAYEKISQIKNVFQSELEHLNLLVTDWAVWDSSYEYMVDRNREYIQNNFTDDILESTQLSRIELFDVVGRSVYVKDEGKLEISPLLDHNGNLQQRYISWEEEGGVLQKSGILILDGKVVLLSLSPVLQGSGKGPDRGTMMMIRVIDKVFLSKINKNTSSTISLIDVTEHPSIKIFDNHEFWIEALDDKTLSISTYLNAPNGEKSVIIQTGFQREFLMESEKMIRYLFIMAAVLGFVSFIVSFYLLNSEVVSPLSHLGAHIVRIKGEGSLEKSGLSKRKDEIGLLATEFNHLIKVLKEKNEVLARVARIDALTGVPNRMDFEERFEEYRRNSCREEKQMAILLLDIDYFKKYNDTYGHVKGDNALISVAKVLKDSLLRPQDYVARYGGEEFVVLLPKTDTDGAVIMARRVIENVLALKLEHASSDLEQKVLSVSVGCFSFIARRGESQEMLIGMADEALYTAKEKGRNQYSVYQRNMV